MTEAGPGAAEIKACCAELYASDWARLLLGESFHPGGLALTERLGELLRLGPGQRVLDVAAGNGESALFLAQRFECQVVGIDFSSTLVAEAKQRAERMGMVGRVWFEQGDAERLPLPSGAFDVVICECAFCTFPNKAAATAELARVLRPGGKFGLADLTRDDSLPDELNSLLAWVGCLADARRLDDYLAWLSGAGFAEPVIERHDEALVSLVRELRGRLLGVELVARLGRFPLPDVDLNQAKQVARAAEAAIAEGRVGYCLLVATRGLLTTTGSRGGEVL